MKCAVPGSSAAASRARPPTPSSNAPTSCARAAITKRPRDFVRGIVDLSAPILRGEIAVAALTVPVRAQQSTAVEMPQAVEHVRAAARQISNEIVHGDLP